MVIEIQFDNRDKQNPFQNHLDESGPLIWSDGEVYSATRPRMAILRQKSFSCVLEIIRKIRLIETAANSVTFFSVSQYKCENGLLIRLVRSRLSMMIDHDIVISLRLNKTRLEIINHTLSHSQS